MNGIDPVPRASMMDVGHLAAAVGGRATRDGARFCGVTTDTRAIGDEDLFVALKGERFDGHDYVVEALKRGASVALVSHEVMAARAMPQVVVDDTRLALGRLAANWRARFAMPVVALTG